jgi:hypothetical protein
VADTYVINTVFKGQDRLSSTISNATSKMTRFGRQSEKSFNRASKSATKFRTIFSAALGANLVTRGVMELQQGVRGLVSEFVDWSVSS